MPVFLTWLREQPRTSDFPNDLPDYVPEEELMMASEAAIHRRKALGSASPRSKTASP